MTWFNSVKVYFPSASPLTYGTTNRRKSMSKLVAICIAILVIPLASFSMQKNGSDDWLDENIIITFEIQQTGQPVQKFSMVTAKKDVSFSQIMKWKVDLSSKEPTPIFIEFDAKLDDLKNDQYRLDSKLALRIPNFVLPEDKEIPFLENGWVLGMIVTEGKKMNIVDNTDLTVTFSLKKFTEETK